MKTNVSKDRGSGRNEWHLQLDFPALQSATQGDEDDQVRLVGVLSQHTPDESIVRGHR